MDKTFVAPVVDTTLPSFIMDGSTNPLNLPSMIENSLIVTDPHYNQAGGARTMKEYEAELNEVKKENFDLKLRIFYMTEQSSLGTDAEDLYKQNIELQVQIEKLRFQLDEKSDLLKEAAVALKQLRKEAEIHEESTSDVFVQTDPNVTEQTSTSTSTETTLFAEKAVLALPSTFDQSSIADIRPSYVEKSIMTCQSDFQVDSCTEVDFPSSENTGICTKTFTDQSINTDDPRHTTDNFIDRSQNTDVTDTRNVLINTDIIATRPSIKLDHSVQTASPDKSAGNSVSVQCDLISSIQIEEVSNQLNAEKMLANDQIRTLETQITSLRSSLSSAQETEKELRRDAQKRNAAIQGLTQKLYKLKIQKTQPNSTVLLLTPPNNNTDENVCAKCLLDKATTTEANQNEPRILLDTPPYSADRNSIVCVDKEETNQRKEAATEQIVARLKDTEKMLRQTKTNIQQRAKKSKLPKAGITCTAKSS